MSDASVTISADLSEFRHEFAIANQFAEQRLKQTANVADREFERLEGAVGGRMKGASGHVGANAEKMSSAVERAASLMGGAFGDVADIAIDLGGKMGGLVGPIGLAAGAVAGLGYAAVQLAGYADEAAKRLEAAGLAAMIPPAAQESLDRYRDGTQTLRNEVDLLAVSLGGPLLDAIGNASFALAGLGDGFDRALAPIGAIQGAIGGVGGGVASTIGGNILAGLTAGGSLVAGALSDAIEGAVASGEQIGEVQRDTAEATAQTVAWVDREAAARRAVEEARAAETAQAETATRVRRTEVALQAATVEGLSGELDARRALQAQRAADAAAEAAYLRQMAAADDAGALASAQSASAAAGLPALGAGVDALGGKIAGAALQGILPMLSGAGGAGSVMGLVGAAGPIGAGIAAVVKLPEIVDGLAGTIGGLANMLEDLPDALTTALTETIPDLLAEGIPRIVGAVVEAVASLPGVIVEAVPAIVASLFTMLPTLVTEIIDGLVAALPDLLVAALKMAISSIFLGGPFTLAIVEGIYEGLKGLFDMLPQGIADAIAKVFERVTDPLRGPEGKFLGTDLTAEGGRSLFGVDLPSFARGTNEVTRTGLAVVHRGEEIRRSGMARGAAAAPVIHVHGPDTREIVRQIREVLGGDYGPGYGLGEVLP